MSCAAIPVRSNSGYADTDRAMGLEYFRILAATSIFYYHAGIFVDLPLSSFAEKGVSAFVVLAGYCAARFSSKRQFRSLGEFGNYFYKRFARVYPVYALITIALFVASFIVYPREQAHPFTFYQLFLNLSMLSQYVGQPYFADPMWFVPFIFQFYLLFPLLRKLSRNPLLFVCLAFGVSAFFALFCSVVFPENAAGICRNWSPLTRLPEFALGMLLATSSGRSLSWLILYAAVALVQAIYGADLLGGQTFADFAGTAFWALPAFAFFFGMGYALASTSTNFLRPTVLNLSDASLAFFMVHGVGMRILFGRFGSNMWVWFGYYALAWIGSIALIMLCKAFTTTVSCIHFRASGVTS